MAAGAAALGAPQARAGPAKFPDFNGYIQDGAAYTIDTTIPGMASAKVVFATPDGISQRTRIRLVTCAVGVAAKGSTMHDYSRCQQRDADGSRTRVKGGYWCHRRSSGKSKKYWAP